MLRKLREKTAQSALEYAILIVIIIGALLSIQIYIKRGVQGRLRESTDSISEQQFSPGNTDYSKTTTTNSSTKQTFTDGKTRQELLGDEVTSVDKAQDIINVDQEYWGAAQDQSAP